ncbi:MAG TPA: hypothetical protein G4N96_02620 [Chloroflexi bacterium]|nr:hypothetical protein [Chloroflexota bacterium]
MNVKMLTSSLSQQVGLPEAELVRKRLLAYIQNEIRLAKLEIANIRERYSVFSKEELYQAIKDGYAVEHPVWEDYIIWKNKLAHIANLRQLATSQEQC